MYFHSLLGAICLISLRMLLVPSGPMMSTRCLGYTSTWFTCICVFVQRNKQSRGIAFEIDRSSELHRVLCSLLLFFLLRMRIPALVVIVVSFVHCCIRVEYCRSNYQPQRSALSTTLETRHNHPTYYNWDDGVGL